MTWPLVFACLSAGLAPEPEPTVRLIATGWDRPTPSRWRRELRDFERLGLFRGAVIQPTRRAEGSDVAANRAFSAEPWRWEEFRSAVDDLRAARSSTVTETFLLLNANPGDADWFDDSAWEQVVDHWRILARVSRLGGLRGILFDTEPYTPPHRQFAYESQAGASRHTFAEYSAKARQRGRAVMQAVAEERPDCTILCFRLLCDLRRIATAEGDASGLLPSQTYGLMPAFVDGWLDVAPPGVRVVEGDEDAYSFNSRAEFDRAFVELRTASARLLSPENRAKYRSHVEIGHGVYLDAYANPPGDRWSIDRKGTTAEARLEANLASASRAGDGWVWINGEKGRWWIGGDAHTPPWPARLPGVASAILRASRPIEAATAAADETSSTNLLADGSFAEADAHRVPRRWWTWQGRGSDGRFLSGSDGRSAEVRGAKEGYLGQTLPADPGATYAASVRARRRGAGVIAATIRWKAADGSWISPAEDVLLTPATPPDKDGWSRLVALARAPDSAAKIVLLLGAEGQSASDVIEFSDARLVRCPPHR